MVCVSEEAAARELPWFDIVVTAYSPPEVDSIRGIWGSYYDILKAIFYLFKAPHRVIKRVCQLMLLWNSKLHDG